MGARHGQFVTAAGAGRESERWRQIPWRGGEKRRGDRSLSRDYDSPFGSYLPVQPVAWYLGRISMSGSVGLGER